MEISNICVLILSSLFETMSSTSYCVVNGKRESKVSTQADGKKTIESKFPVIAEFKTLQEASDFIKDLTVFTTTPIPTNV